MDDCPGNTTPKGERGCSCSLFLSRPKWSEGTRPFRLDGLVGRYRPVPGCRWASGYRPVSGCRWASGYRPVSAGCRWASGCRPGTGYLPISGYPYPPESGWGGGLADGYPYPYPSVYPDFRIRLRALTGTQLESTSNETNAASVDGVLGKGQRSSNTTFRINFGVSLTLENI